jgi:uncharacterized membrane protein YbhN (UPF0104 family)
MRVPIRFFGRVWLIAFLLAAAAAIWRYGSDLSTHLTKLQHASVANLVALLALQLVFWSILALAWRLILRTLGARDTPFAVCFWQQMLVMLGKYVPGKIWGMVARGGEMKRRGDGFSQVVTATSLEQMLLLHSGMVVAALILPLLFPSVETGILAAIAVLTIPVAARFSSAGLRMLGAFVRRFDRTVRQPAEVRIATGRYTVMVATYGSLWIISGLVFINLYGIFVERHFTTELFVVLMLSNVAAIAAGFLALFAPGGIGVREGVMIGLLLPYIPVEHAMLLAIVSRLWQVMSDVLGGALGLWLARHPRNPD